MQAIPVPNPEPNGTATGESAVGTRVRGRCRGRNVQGSRCKFPRVVPEHRRVRTAPQQALLEARHAGPHPGLAHPLDRAGLVLDP